MKTTQQQIRELQEEVEKLRSENQQLKNKLFSGRNAKTVTVPPQFSAVFDVAEQHVRSCFEEFSVDPGNGEIMVGGERYLLFNSASLSYEFLDIIRELYSNRSLEEATRIGNNFRFDIAHVLGKKDALSFHERMNLKDPIEKLSAGPVHFAYTGWANVEILPESNPSPDEHFFLKYYHHNSFEAQAWKKAGRTSDIPVCTMSCGYSSGWCEESFGIPLTAVELECEAAGDERCLFVMAPPSRIAEYLQQTENPEREAGFEVPVFFEKKYTEDRLRDSLAQKEALLSEVHHRVKNNLQIISSLLNLQMEHIKDASLRSEFNIALMRIKTMALIHEMIYSDKLVSSVPVKHYFRHLFLSLVQYYQSGKKRIDIQVKIDDTEHVIPSDTAIPLGLIINEILGNAMGEIYSIGGTLLLQMDTTATDFILILQADAPAINENEEVLSLLPLLCEQAGATCNTVHSRDRLTYRIQFKKTVDNNA